MMTTIIPSRETTPSFNSHGYDSDASTQTIKREGPNRVVIQPGRLVPLHQQPTEANHESLQIKHKRTAQSTSLPAEGRNHLIHEEHKSNVQLSLGFNEENLKLSNDEVDGKTPSTPPLTAENEITDKIRYYNIEQSTSAYAIKKSPLPDALKRSLIRKPHPTRSSSP